MFKISPKELNGAYSELTLAILDLLVPDFFKPVPILNWPFGPTKSIFMPHVILELSLIFSLYKKLSIFAFLRPFPWFKSEIASKIFVLPEPFPPYINTEEFFKLRFKLLWFLKFFKLTFLM